MKKKEIEDNIRKLVEGLLTDEENSIRIDNNELLDVYGMTSETILKLIIEIENIFNFRFTDEDFDEKNFETISAIVLFVERKISASN